MDMFKRLTNKLRGKDEPIAEQPEAPEIALEKLFKDSITRLKKAGRSWKKRMRRNGD